MTDPKAMSVTRDGKADGWTPSRGFRGDVDDKGETRLVISVGSEMLSTLHQALLAALASPLGVLYRQKVDRSTVGPEDKPPLLGYPERDFVALGISYDRLYGALERGNLLLYHDARCELWIRGASGAQVVLDSDGVLFCYPDNPGFREVLMGLEVTEEEEMQTLHDRDYARHSFLREADDMEEHIIEELGLVEMSPQG